MYLPDALEPARARTIQTARDLAQTRYVSRDQCCGGQPSNHISGTPSAAADGLRSVQASEREALNLHAPADDPSRLRRGPANPYFPVRGRRRVSSRNRVRAYICGRACARCLRMRLHLRACAGRGALEDTLELHAPADDPSRLRRGPANPYFL